MAKKNFYAVKQGRQVGIFPTWDECKAQTDGYAGAIFKGFTTYDEAENWFNADQATIKTGFICPKCGCTKYGTALNSNKFIGCVKCFSWFIQENGTIVEYDMPEPEWAGVKTVSLGHIKLPPEWKLDINPEDEPPWD